MPEQKRRRLFELPPREETELQVQEQSADSMPDMAPEENPFRAEKQDAQPVDLKNKITRSIIRMLKKRGPPTMNEEAQKP